MCQLIRGFGGNFVFPIGKRNTDFVSGRPSCFSDQPPPPPKLVEDVEVLLSVKFAEFRSAVSEENLKICLSVKFP